jgi:ABC-3C biological conflict system middle component
LREDRALLTIGSEILGHLDEPRTVSELWERVRFARSGPTLLAPLPFDWFVLALNLLYAMSALEMSDGVVSKVGAP